MQLKALIFIITVLGFLTTNAQTTGSISGKITDGRDSLQKVIIGAQVFIEGTSFGGFTGVDGSYNIQNVPEGKYTVTVSYVLIGNEKIENVKVLPGQNTVANLPMGKKVEESGLAIKLVLHKDKESENSAVNEMKTSEEVVEVLSSAEMSKKGDNKASDAVKRISGVSIVDGKYAYIRGLSDRYSKTLLNNADIPGLDPDRVAVQLDLFPSAFIQRMDVVKSYTPDLPADFTGGLVDIKTKESFDSLTIKASIGTSYNSQVHLNEDYLLYEGSSTDWLGFDDGKRDFSPIVNEATALGEVPFISSNDVTDAASKEQFETFNQSLSTQMEPENKTVPFDHNFKIAMGNTIDIKRKDSLKFNRSLGYFLGANYRRSYSYYDNGESNRYDLINDVLLDSTLWIKRKLSSEKGKDEVLIGTFSSLFFRFNPDHKIKLNVIHNHTGTSEASFAEGRNEQVDNLFRVRSLSYLQRSMNTFQLSGEHSYDTLLFKTPLKIDWITSYTRSSQEQPDLRFFADEQVNNVNGNPVSYRVKTNIIQPTRFNRGMSQNNIDSKVNFTKHVRKDSTEMTFKSGFALLHKNRSFNEARLLYPGTVLNHNGNANDYISNENLTITFDSIKTRVDTFLTANVPLELQNQYRDENQYRAKQTVAAYYFMASFPLTHKMNMVTGARAEWNKMTVESDNITAGIGELNNLDILPVVNLDYHFFENRTVQSKRDTNDYKKQDLKLQFIYSRTVARPTFREIAPFKGINFFQGYDEIGNSNLERTTIDNLDLRLEYYPNSGEILSASLFFKNFNNPIQRSSNAETAELEYTWVNSPSAFLYGIEGEIKRSMNFISPQLQNFKLGINATYLKSQVTITDKELFAIRGGNPFYGNTRPLTGQSPFLINSFVQYDHDSSGLSAILTYNVFGERLSLISEEGVPNIYERGRAELNFSVAKKLGKRSKITFRARNLLNPAYEFYYKFESSDEINEKFLVDGDYLFSTNKRGRRYSVSYSYTF